MLKRYSLALLIFLTLVLLGRDALQYQQLPIDGDLAVITLPTDWYTPVLHDPFGWSVLTQNAVYAGPNRFFAHLLINGYFNRVPLWLHAFSDPIKSVYIAITLFKLGTQVLLLYLLATYATNAGNLRSRSLWVIIVLMLPLFQTAGYNSQMGIIDHAVTYVGFYAVPMVLLFLLLLPFYRAAQRGEWRSLSWLEMLGCVGLIVLLAFNGPTIPGIAAVLIPGILLYWLRQRQAAQQLTLRAIPWQPTLLLFLFGALCLYSLYIGLNNAENEGHFLPLWERYKLLPKGFFHEFTYTIGLPLLVGMVLLNAWLIRYKAPSAEGKRLLLVLQWLLVFSGIYIALLPLGGYRSYRPNIIRRDVILPIILGLVFFYATSAYYLLRHFTNPASRQKYLVVIGVFSAVYLGADSVYFPANENKECQRQAMVTIAQAPDSVVQLTSACNLLAWTLISTPSESQSQARMMKRWGITQKITYFYHVTEEPR